MNNYKKLEDCWGYQIENYNPVTLNYQDYKDYLASGRNAIDASGGVRLGNILVSGVISGPVRQNAFTANRYVNNRHFWKTVANNTAGLSWIN